MVSRMIRIIYVGGLCMGLSLLIFLLIYTLSKCKSIKRAFFMLCVPYNVCKSLINKSLELSG